MHMAKKNDFAPALPLVIVVLFLFGFTAHAQTYNLKVPTSVCQLKAIDSCFNDSLRQKSFTVGKEVTKLSDLYTFCTSIKVVKTGKAARIILALDNSRSMCSEVTSCAGASNNDPTNTRVDGANQFVDSVAGRCPDCEVGVIVYTGVGDDSTGSGTISRSITPIPLNSTANITRLHQTIDRAKCGATGFQKKTQPANLSKRALTFTGIALDSAIRMIDVGFDTLGGMERHIILLTDGDWQKPTTSEIIAAYAQTFPGRQLPVVHGVFISDSAAHVAAGFPPYGLVTCDSLTKIPMDMSFLQLAAQSTKGMYFPGSTPQTIVATFQSLFKVIIDTNRVGLASVTFTNMNTGEIRKAEFKPDPAVGGRYIINVPAYNLEIGANTFVITWVTQDTNNVRLTKNDTFSVTRQTTVGTGTTKVFKTECFVDTVDMMISCKPTELLTGAFDTVWAKVDPADVTKFVPNNVIVRGFTAFPDETDNRVIALFHLDDKITNNNVYNSAPGGRAGTGAPNIATTGAFGSAMSAGSFTMAVPMPITGAFTVECWIRTATGQTGDIIKGSDFYLGLADGYLTAKIGNIVITTTNAIDKNVWQHVAVARENGKVNIYINGIPMAVDATNSTSGLAGNLTVGNFAGGLIDEIRVSTFARTTVLQGKTLVTIPIVDNLVWKINATNPTASTAVLPPEMWQAEPKGELKFQFSDLLPAPVIINFFDTLAQPPLMWSKNGDPVLFGTLGVQVTAILRDTSHEGHLDRMDITWNEAITLKPNLPGVSEIIGTLIITTLDGKQDTLHAVTIVPDATNKVLHVILNENQGQLETAWKDAKGIVLKDVPLTTDGKPFVIVKVLDGAEPVPIAACYAPADREDTVKITFSESIMGDSISMDRIFRVSSQRQEAFSKFAPKATKVDNTLIVIFPYNAAGGEHAIAAYDWNIQEFYVSGPPSKKISIDYCATVSLVLKFQIGPNPVDFSTGAVATRSVQFPDNPTATKQIKGQIFELILKRPVQGPDGSHIVKAWVTVFDAVGNVLVDKAPMGVDSKNRVKLLWAWDGKNKKNMQVSGGTYLARYLVQNFNNGVIVREEAGSAKTGIRTAK
jgi:hypothetical protein